MVRIHKLLQPQGSHASCRNCDQTTLIAQTAEMYSLADYWDYVPYPCDEPSSAGRAANKKALGTANASPPEASDPAGGKT